MSPPVSYFPLVIVGGGLAGALAALAISHGRPDLPILLLEAGDKFGGNHTWSFFDSDTSADSRYWVDALQPWRSPIHRVSFPSYERTIRQGYNSVESARLDTLVRERLAPDCWRCNCKVVNIEAGRVILAGGEVIRAAAVIDARGPERAMSGLELGWQKFVGIEYSGSQAKADSATIMDGKVEQIDGYRFIYTLPLAADRVLVEDTYYSDGPELDVDLLASRVRAAAAAQGIGGQELRREHGVLPIVIDGHPDVFWPKTDPIARLGIRGGFFHPTTGYSFALALRLALELARQRDLSAPAIATWSRQQFCAHWRDSSYYRLLNRMMFRAASPAERRRIFERFYRLPEPLIARFYSGDLTLFDKARLVAGRPPVPFIAAVRAACQPFRLPAWTGS